MHDMAKDFDKLQALGECEETGICFVERCKAYHNRLKLLVKWWS